MRAALSLIATLSLLATECSGHYIFQQLTVNNKKFAVYEHIRKNTNYNSPVTSLASKDLVCNVGGITGGSTTILDVKAGSNFTFTTDVAVYHQGPISIFMSKAPGSVSDYTGDGDWFKILDLGPTFTGNGQATWPLRTTYSYSIPQCIEDGEYLLRIQSLGIHNPWPAGIPQFYISCAQLNITGGGHVKPEPTVKIPGAFKETDPGYTANIYNNFKSYTVPGGPVWKGC